MKTVCCFMYKNFASENFPTRKFMKSAKPTIENFINKLLLTFLSNCCVSCDARHDMDEQEHLQRVALEECNVRIVNKLDVSAILPYLISHHLLTDDDKQVLMTYAKTQVEKAQYLLDILPRKAKGWFEVFIECLRETSLGTGHGDVVEDLEVKLQELVQQNISKKKKKAVKLGSKPSSAEEPQQPVGDPPQSGQTDVSDV